MRKGLVAIVGLLASLLLAACGGAAAQNSAGAAAGAVAESARPGTAGARGENYENALPAASRLILGSLKLEETDKAIDADEAAKLLPLWQAYQSLGNSDTTAAAELEALVKQIERAMRPEQVAAIAAMQLTADDIGEVLQAQGGRFFGGGFGNRGANEGGNGGGRGPGGGPPEGGFLIGPGGGPPGGGPGGGFGGGFGGESPEARATAIAERLAQNPGQAAAFMTRGMVNQLITTLQLKTGDLTEADLQAQRAQRMIFRWLPVVADASGVPVETLQEALSGGSTLAEAIQANSGDLAAAEAAIRDALKEIPDLDAQAIEEQVTSVLQGKVAAE